MLFLTLNFLLGIMVFSTKNTLSLSIFEISLFFALLLAVLVTFRRQKSIAINLVLFMLGFVWMGLFSNQTLQINIDEKFFNTTINVIGTIEDIPKVGNNKTQFIFKASSPFKAKLKLSWYEKSRVKIHSGDQWKFLIKIKHNNSYQNKGGFDYEKWLFFKQFDATGYVKKSDSNQLLAPNTGLSIDLIRHKIQQRLVDSISQLEFIGVINALIIGDRSLVNNDHWELFKSTNTTHLSVISGLHIGLISGFIFLFSSFLWRQCRACTLKLPASVIGAYFGLFSAFSYALIAGFSIPTQRAFIMASVVFLSIILRRNHNGWQLYGSALLLVLVSNPLSVFSVGFWLSFYVVAIIIYGVKQHQNKHWLFRLLYIQLLISLSTIPLIAWFFSSGSILSPIANIIAIPVFSFITTPFSLFGIILSYAQLDWLSGFVFSVANQSLIYLSIFLHYLQSFEFNQWQYTPVSASALVLLIISILIGLLPSALKLRQVALILAIVALFQPHQQLKQGEVVITTLDVGQGLAQVVRTQNHVLMFDTGARYRSGFNMGEAVIVPYLQTQQIDAIDLLIISHGDNDHIGGLDSLLKKISVKQIISSVPEKISTNSDLCKTKPSWKWDGVDFQMLNTTHDFNGNNASCVLKISTSKHSIILTGDIEKKAEQHLVNIWDKQLKADVLISPHHGSKTSSSELFLATVAPKLVIISSGYKNRFNHPAKIVIDRYKAHNIVISNTNCSGQIDVALSQEITITHYRQAQKRYYWRQCE
ncbi:DNA internalization-related competence protein ComEC/Rec2 [uncultured Gammaproteobacteria bacterium]|nr:DNA internalization-related competence protein ComEC/Rec2 [uncultured Gammaproteobacteria bacterium]